MATVGEYLFRLQDLSFFSWFVGREAKYPWKDTVRWQYEHSDGTREAFLHSGLHGFNRWLHLDLFQVRRRTEKMDQGVHKDGDTCNHVNDSSTVGTEEEDICADCMSGSPSSGGSSQSANGKGKKKKGKNKDKKVFSSLLSDICLECLYHVTQLSFVPYYVLSFVFWLM